MQHNYLDDKPGRTVRINGKEHLFFSGYNYLGVIDDSEFHQLVMEGASRFGWLFPSSRISNTRIGLYEECEALLSTITGTEDTILTPSGFTAGQMSVREQNIINAPGAHPAILRSRSGHESFAEWIEWLVTGFNCGQLSGAVASDAVNPLTAVVNDFRFLADIKRDLKVVLDDSHGIGLIGDGKGISALVPAASHIDYTYTYSLSKAFGIPAGAISCSASEGARLRQQPEYAAVTPASPAMIFAFVHGQAVYSRQLRKVRSNIRLFAEAVSDLPGISSHPDLPVFILNDTYQAEELLKNDILISSFAYPDPKGRKLNRIVLNALHTSSDIERLSDVLHDIFKSKKERIPI
jgi:8-amino-7-oxononanoate synthase